MRTLDPDDMLGHISRLPKQCRDAWESIQKVSLPDVCRQAKNIIVLGLGGSAIGGDLVRTLVQYECALPMIIHRDYQLPAFVGPETLAIASSHSGDTEETLTTAAAALRAGAQVVAVTTGGELARWAEQNSLPLILFTYPSQPRAALGHSMILTLGILCRAGVVSGKERDLQEALAVMESWQAEIRPEVPVARNPAKQMAQWLSEGLPVVYGAGYLSEVARRWKGQFNENAKSWAFFEQMPELNHNAVAGYKFPEAVRERIRVVILGSSLDHPSNQKRFLVTQEILDNTKIAWRRVDARGRSPLAQMLSAVHFGDYVSYYLAMLYRTDPTPIDLIAYLKRRLAA